MSGARHILLTKEETLPVVIVVGDPGRVDKVKVLAESYKDLHYSREYKSAELTYKGQKFLCVSHGVGSAGAAICFQELINNGAKVIIRVGSCGSLQPKTIKRGDVCICTAGVREDRASHLLVPADYPAVADFDVYEALVNAAKERNFPYFTGISLSTDLYYKANVIEDTLQTYVKSNVKVSEMEVATLMILGSIYNVKTGGIFIVDGSPLEWDEGNINVVLDPAKLEGMIMISLDACAKLASQYK